jgi:hypothetical protein
MFPYSLGVLTLLQGFYSLLWIVILMDVLSPTLDLRRMGSGSDAQGLLMVAGLFIITFTVGVAMHTISRNLFRKIKDQWEMDVLTSAAVRQRLADHHAMRPSGGPSLQDVHDAEGFDRVRKAGEFMHALSYVLQIRAPGLYDSIQVYRDQYRLARGFIVPSLILAVVLPFWQPVPAGNVGSFPVVSFQLFFLEVFFAGVAMYAFKERSYRYAAALIRSYLTIEIETQQSAETQDHLAAVS